MSEHPTPGPSLKKRWRRFVLRTQGRLDGEGADRLLPWTYAVIAFLVFAALNAASIRSLEGGSGLGAWLQAAWGREHGGVIAPVGGADPARASWSLISEPILFLCRFIPAQIVFIVVQAAALAAGLVPLWRISREDAGLRVGAASVVSAAYVLAPTLQRTNLAAFHPEAIALPALLWAYLQARRGHWVSFTILVAVVLSCRADLGLTVVALGLVVMVLADRRAGLITAAVGLAWTIVAVLVIDPAIPTVELTPSGEFVARSAGPLAVVPDLFQSPLSQIELLLSEPGVQFLIVVFAPLLFLPLLASRRVLAALPCLMLAMIADSSVQQTAQSGVVTLAPAAGHIAPAMAFVFIALVFALERIGDRNVSRVNIDRRVITALLVGCVLFFVTAAPSSPYRQPWAWGSQDIVDGARLEATSRIGDEAAVAVSPRSTALVAARADVLELPVDPADLMPVRVRQIAQRVDVIVLDTLAIDPSDGQPYWPQTEKDRVLDAFGNEGYAVTYEAQGIYLLEPSDQALVDASE